MTIQERTAKVLHPRVLQDGGSGQLVKLHSTRVTETFGKDILFIPRQRPYSQHFIGPVTLAYDSLNIEHTFTVQAIIKDATESIADDNPGMVSVVDGTPEISITGETFKVHQFNAFVPLGGTKIKFGSVNVPALSSSDYEVDRDRGRILLNDSAGGSTNTDYDIEYTVKGTADNIARMIVRMSQRGGNLGWLYNSDEFTVSGSPGATDGDVYNVQASNIEWNKVSDRPEQVEISLDLRVSDDYE